MEKVPKEILKQILGGIPNKARLRLVCKLWTQLIAELGRLGIGKKFTTRLKNQII